MTAASLSMRASDSILEHRESWARQITDALYAADPTLLERFGPAGRAKCLQDMVHCLEHLAPAVAMEDTSIFARYVIWVVKLLAVRAVDSGHVRRSLEATRSVLADRLESGEWACVRGCLQEGVASCPAPAS